MNTHDQVFFKYNSLLRGWHTNACALSVSVEPAITGWCVFMWVSSLDQVFHSNQRNTEESHGRLSSSRTMSTLPEHFTKTTPQWTAAACVVHLKIISMFISSWFLYPEDVNQTRSAHSWDEVSPAKIKDNVCVSWWQNKYWCKCPFYRARSHF